MSRVQDAPKSNLRPPPHLRASAPPRLRRDKPPEALGEEAWTEDVPLFVSSNAKLAQDVSARRCGREDR